MILVDTDSTTGGKAMAVRLVVTFHAAPVKGTELAQAMKARCEISWQDAGCEQFEVVPEPLRSRQAGPARIMEGPGGARRPRQTAGAAPAFAGGVAARRWRARGLYVQPYPLNRGEAPECRSRISKPAATTRPRTCRGNGRCRLAPTTARRACAPFAAWSSAAGMSRNWVSTGSGSPSIIIRRTS